MALARSASGPGGLSINTGSANSLFGSTTSQAPASGGLFGNPSKPATGGLFGNSTATTSSAPATGGLFGSSTTTTSAPASGGLFGSTTTATSQPTQTGGLFGGAAATSQPAQSGGLFGASTTTSTAQTQQSSGLFGNAATQKPGGLFAGQQTQTQAAPTGSMFGGTSNQQGQSTGGLFGGLNNQTKTATPSLFGAQSQPNQPQQQQQQQPSLFGGGLQLGQSTSTQTTVPGVRIDASQLKSTTRFNDLHEDLQKEIESIDLGIQRAQSQSHDIAALLPSHSDQLSFIPPNVDFLTRKLLGVESAHEGDAESLELVQKLIEKDLHNATLSFRAVDILNLPQQYQQAPRHFSSYNNTSRNGAETQDIVSFFSQSAEEMTASLDTYQKRIGEIERHLRSVEVATIQQAQALSTGGEKEDEMREIALVLREFEAGILAVAGKVGIAKEGLQKLQLGTFEDLGRERAKKVNGNGKRTGIY